MFDLPVIFFQLSAPVRSSGHLSAAVALAAAAAAQGGGEGGEWVVEEGSGGSFGCRLASVREEVKELLCDRTELFLLHMLKIDRFSRTSPHTRTEMLL